MRNVGFCGTLLGQHSQDSRLRAQPDWQDFQDARANEGILVRHETSEHIYVLCEGWAFRFLQLRDGRRQILRFLLSGDLFSAVTLFAEDLPFSAQALTQVRLSRFKRAAFKGKIGTNPGFLAAVAAICTDEDTSAGEFLLALGRRTAEERIAHLFLHLMGRIASRSVIREQRYPFPLRQWHIADMTGLTPVHVSRVLGYFRDRGLCRLSGGILEVLNPAGLERLGAIG